MSEAFARAAAEALMTVEKLVDAPLEARIVGVSAELSRLYSLGSTVAGSVSIASNATAPPLSPWPGFGSFEAYWRETDEGPVPMRASETLWFVLGCLWTGLERWQEGQEDRAVDLWGCGWDATWGPASLELIAALHPAVVGYRSDARSARTSRAKGPRVPSLLRAAPATSTPSIGLQVRSVQDLVLVLVVHPKGPSMGVLEVGDVILSIDGVPADAEERPRGLVVPGGVGETHRYEVFRNGETNVVEIESVDVGVFK